MCHIIFSKVGGKKSLMSQSLNFQLHPLNTQEYGDVLTQCWSHGITITKPPFPLFLPCYIPASQALKWLSHSTQQDQAGPSQQAVSRNSCSGGWNPNILTAYTEAPAALAKLNALFSGLAYPLFRT